MRRTLQAGRTVRLENHLLTCWLADCKLTARARHQIADIVAAVTCGLNSASDVSDFRGIRKAAVAITAAGGQTLDQYWEDGPQFTDWGAVVGKYPDGTPAIVEGTFGSGWVILTGVHPEAPAGWRRGMTFITPVSVDNAYAGTLVDAALNRVSLSHY